MAQPQFFQLMLVGMIAATLATGGMMSTLFVQTLTSNGIHYSSR